MTEAIETGNESRWEWMLDRFGFLRSKNSLNQDFQVWALENHALVLHTNPFIFEKLNYMHNNPVRSGIFERSEKYICSSAKNYAEMPATMEMLKLSLPLITY